MAVAGVAVLVGCSQEQSRSYRVPKEANAPTTASAPAMTAPTAGARPSIRWSALPPGWKEGAATSMRVASFSVESGEGQKAEISVTPLAGGTNMEEGAVNMWRGEMEIPELPPAEVPRAGDEVRVGGAKGKLYDMAGTAGGKPARILGAVLDQGGSTWFFKMKGADALVAAQKSAFVEFLNSVQFVEASQPVMAAAAPSAPAVSAAPRGGGANIPPPEGLSRWEVPPHWQAAPPKTMLLAVLTVPGGGELTVSSFPGDVGGIRANVDRWRRQIGLAPSTDAEFAQSTSAAQMNGVAATLVDVRNSGGGQRTVAAVLPHAGNSWFFKLSGPDPVLEKEKQGFIKFVESVRFP